MKEESTKDFYKAKCKTCGEQFGMMRSINGVQTCFACVKKEPTKTTFCLECNQEIKDCIRPQKVPQTPSISSPSVPLTLPPHERAENLAIDFCEKWCDGKARAVVELRDMIISLLPSSSHEK